MPLSNLATASPLPFVYQNPRFSTFHGFHGQNASPKIRSVLSSQSTKDPPSSDTSLLERRLDTNLCDPRQFPSIQASKRVVLVRHGQSTWNEEGRIQGSSDISVLTQKGESQAETSRQMLIGDSFDVCFTSPLSRSKRTAEIIWFYRKDEMISEPDLREIDLYSFQGLLKHEGKSKFGNAYRQWQIDAANFNIDGHYPVRELWARARNCWDKILRHNGRSVLVVAHNAVNQALVATAIGLHFHLLLANDCGISAIYVNQQNSDSTPTICLQTPNPPIAPGSSGGRKTNKRIILVCHGTLQSTAEGLVPALGIPALGNESMNMLGVIQSQKTAELLLDLKVNTIICGPYIAASDTASAICKVQEAADCLGADCVPRYVEIKQMKDLEYLPFHSAEYEIAYKSSEEEGASGLLWEKAGNAWLSILTHLRDEPESENNIVVVGHPLMNIALIGRCLNLRKDWMKHFHLDYGSISVLDFPDGPAGKGLIRCTNYTAHLGRWSVPVTRSASEDDEF
ncbi:probable 2-carboxy-D-arabinitol-1-phosphatase [Amborella trichopoda]|uniref:probable 2-carboxy-D-arabinitol-1-phosphatase n=1 Tax=Amborella trichopoda TaxID=13333 RepID=UPI0005D38232|nr:probable 2-carboxy-D-arabinitol-1-phosphatase [Amborella trichopoda]|eukprot:XP_011625980.1 probable 2-carboxy-D-arabinitol-1-phosphatase [Amborella trichopoda]